MERQIYSATDKQGVFGCFEVTIGWNGNERVDYITYDTKGIWRCYEVKVSKSDFYSKSKTTFIGHYNYYVMPKELYDLVKDDIPSHVGVYLGNYCVKKPKKQSLAVDETILINSLIRSLSRDAQKVYKSESPLIVDSLRRQLSNEKKQKEKYRENLQELSIEVREKFGTRWRYE